MPRLRFLKSTIDALPTPAKDAVHWDETLPGFGLKVTPSGRKVFIVLYRTGGAGSRLRKYTIGPYGRVTLHVAKAEAQKILGARLEGRDPAAEKQERRRKLSGDSVAEVVDSFISKHVAQRRSAGEISRILRREVVQAWGSRSIHTIRKGDVIALISAVVERGSPVAANKLLKVVRTFFGWCVGRALLDRSPCEGVRLPTVEVSRDRVLTDQELAAVLKAARAMGGPYGGIIELLALTGQRREEVARLQWQEVDPQKGVWTLSGARTKNGKPHVVHLAARSLEVIAARPAMGAYVFAMGPRPFSDFSRAKQALDKLSGVSGWRLHDLRRTAVSGMAGLGVAPHVADKILNHASGTVSGVAAVYQRHAFMAQRKEALELWAAHVERITQPFLVRSAAKQPQSCGR